MLNLKRVFSNNQISHLSKKGYKMTQLHFTTDNHPATPNGLKVCIFGGTSNLGPNLAAHLVTKGSPCLMVHRNALDVTSPLGNDLTLIRSNPYRSWSPFILNYNLIPDALGNMRIWSELGMRYFQLVHDLTNPYDVEVAIKDCDIVINLIGQKPVNRKDEYYEEPNIVIAREIAKMCAKKKDNNVKRLFHFSACGVGPDAISTRLRTKWQGEQEVLKYFPEATIMRPTTIVSNSNQNNFLGHYLHCWNNNNGTVLLLDEGKAKRAPVIDHDVCMAVVNALSLENSKGQIYELGATNSYLLRELYEYFGNAMSHRPKYISYSFEDFMKLHLGPNSNFEKSINWLVSRPDYLSELRYDIVAKKRDGVKTFEDLFITPVAPHHFILDLSNFMIEKMVIDKEYVRDHDEHDADWDSHPM